MKYDIAIIGAGCAGWQLLYQLSKLPNWNHKKVLLIDENEFPKVYPTWCFWVKDPHPFEFLSSKSWNEISIGLSYQILEKSMAPYRYLFIEGDKFYNYFNKEFLPSHPNITFLRPFQVEEIDKNSDHSFILKGSENLYYANKVYSSRNFSKAVGDEYLHLSQNFVGWKIEFDSPMLNPDKVLFMDFRMSSEEIFEFMYLLPFSTQVGLFEWTTFIHKSHPEPNYEEKINQYLKQYFPSNPFKILKKEFGEIPMTNYPYKGEDENGLIYIGSAAGMIKSSTGYTFNRITRDSQALAQISLGKQVRRPISGFKFRYYDTLLLRTLRDEPNKVIEIFKSLFINIHYPIILRFLDEETSFFEDVKIFSGLPFFPLIRSLFKK